MISFEDRDGLEFVLEGCPWFFRKQLIVFDKLLHPMDRDKICPISSPFWLKIGPCAPECDKKTLMHTVGSTFGGVLKYESKGDFCRLKVRLEVRRPLRRGIFYFYRF